MHVGLCREDRIQMGCDHEVGMGFGPGPITENISCMVDTNICQAALLEKPSEFCGSFVFMKWRGGYLTDPNLLFDKVRLVRFDRLHGRLDIGSG
jgi:hypothetical protein